MRAPVPPPPADRLVRLCRAGRTRPAAASVDACEARPSAVAESSWLAAAFCCTTSSSWLTPTLISRIAAICSCEAAAIS